MRNEVCSLTTGWTAFSETSMFPNKLKISHSLGLMSLILSIDSWYSVDYKTLVFNKGSNNKLPGGVFINKAFDENTFVTLKSYT